MTEDANNQIVTVDGSEYNLDDLSASIILESWFNENMIS